MDEQKIPISRLLKIDAELTDRETTNAMKEACVTASQMRLLVVLKFCGDIIPTEKTLEQELHISQPSIAGLIRRMEEKGLVTTSPSPLDGRARYVSLTEKGRETCLKARDGAEKIEAQMTCGMTPQELCLFRTMLIRVFHNLSGTTANKKEMSELEICKQSPDR